MALFPLRIRIFQPARWVIAHVVVGMLAFCIARSPQTALANETQAVPSREVSQLTLVPAPPSQPAVALAATEESALQATPVLYQLHINQLVTLDIEVIQTPTGDIRYPFMALTTALDLAPQISPSTSTFVCVDPVTQHSIVLNWGTQTLEINGVASPPPGVPYVFSEAGFIYPQEVYVDEATAEALLRITLTANPTDTAIDLETTRPLKALQSADPLNSQQHDNTLPLAPPVVNSLLERFTWQYRHNTDYQVFTQPATRGTAKNIDYFAGITNTLSLGIHGKLWGREYAIQPTFIRFNGLNNLQTLDWHIIDRRKRVNITLGSFDAGLSPLTSQNLPLWGLKIASKNADTPIITPVSYRTYRVTPKTGQSSLQVELNGKVVQEIQQSEASSPPTEIELEPVYLEPEKYNHLRVLERDSAGQLITHQDETVAYYNHLLAKGDSAYSAFIGRVPMQFQPLGLAQDDIRYLMAQSNKWFAGGRYWYGVGHQLTAGVQAAADHIWGPPKTFFLNPTPLTADLSGILSYQRNPNFWQGQNLSLTARGQLGKHLAVISDFGFSQYHLKPGSFLPIARNGLGAGGRIALTYTRGEGQLALDGFHYSPYYYSPNSLNLDTQYDKQGIGVGLSNRLGFGLNGNIQVRWERYATNLANLVPGGQIIADTWRANGVWLITPKTTLTGNMSWTAGRNRERELHQRSTYVQLAQKLPRDWTGRLIWSDFSTDLAFLSDTGNSGNLLFRNTSLDTQLEIPLKRLPESYVQLGHLYSTFTNSVYINSVWRYKRLQAHLNWQQSYGGTLQSLNRVDARIGYTWRNGIQTTLGYAVGQTGFDNRFGNQIKTVSQQLYVEFSGVYGRRGDRYGMLPNGWNTSTAMLSGRAFVDMNRNGSLDPGEPGIPGMDLVLDDNTVQTTNAQGQFLFEGVGAGTHALVLKTDSLPASLDIAKPMLRLALREGQHHNLNIPVIPQGGSIRGVVMVDKVNDSIVANDPVMLVITNRAGAIVNYTQAKPGEAFVFSNLPPDTYTVALENKLAQSGLYKVMQAPAPIEITPAQSLDALVEVENQRVVLLKLR